MRRSADLIGIDASIYRVDDICDAGTHATVKATRITHETRCPERGRRVHVHGSTNCTAYHAPYKGKPCLITLRKRRYKCSSRNKTFTEDHPLLSRLTPHASCGLEAFAADELKCGRAIAELERITGASKNILTKLEAGMRIPRRYLPHNLCIDEVKALPKKAAIRRGEPHMASCVYGADKKMLIDMLTGDDPKTVSAYWTSFAKGERDIVETISCDLNGTYVRLAEKHFPGAVIYADKLHVSKLVTEAVDDARKRLNRTIEDDKAHAEQRRILRKASKLMLTRKGKLKSVHERTCARCALETDKADELKRAYLALQLFFEWPDKTYGSRDAMGLALNRWVSIARRTNIPEMRPASNTINRRKSYILNAWEQGRTNAVAESLNRQIKDIIRNCRGFMSFEALRHRCLLVLGHEHKPNKPIPLFARSDKGKEGAN